MSQNWIEALGGEFRGVQVSQLAQACEVFGEQFQDPDGPAQDRGGIAAQEAAEEDLSLDLPGVQRNAVHLLYHRHIGCAVGENVLPVFDDVRVGDAAQHDLARHVTQVVVAVGHRRVERVEIEVGLHELPEFGRKCGFESLVVFGKQQPDLHGVTLLSRISGLSPYLSASAAA